MKKIYIVILHYGSLEVTKKCVNSLYKNEHYFTKLIIVNNSNITLTPKNFNKKEIKIINNGRNLGFAGGVNVGITFSLKEKANYIVLLNNDTQISKPFIEGLINVFKKHSDLGIVGPSICFQRNNLTIYDLGGKINWLIGRTTHDEVGTIDDNREREVDYVTGAAMIIKREVFEKIGLFDDSFFLYYEDVDFCIRAHKKGYKIMVNPKVIITHALSKTVGKVSPLAVFHQTRSGLLFGKKYFRRFPYNIYHRVFIIMQTAIIMTKHPSLTTSLLKAFYTQ